MLVEIHMIQNHSPQNLNRDDLGAPKTCMFGGVVRARISSQCLKRSIRNPGNAHDIHSREPGLFAAAMAGHIGTKTKFFPWLVQQALKDSAIPVEEHRRIVLAAQRIAASKEKAQKKTPVSGKSDDRPTTAQLIHLGPGHAKYYVDKLAELRDTHNEQYEYFLNPVVGFQEMVRESLLDSSLDEKEQERIVKVSYVIAKCRMHELLKPTEGEEPEPEPEMEDEQPGGEHARLIAGRLAELRVSDEKRFKDLTKPETKEEKQILKDTAPEKPKGKKTDEFANAIRAVKRCDAVDIALFGRMTTSHAFEDVEAAMQVAHAISTHNALTEVDYFTAVDDLGKTGGGAGYVDEGMYASACFYKYFSLDWDQLVCNLTPADADIPIQEEAKKLAAAALGHFIRAAAQTTPSGKQNSFASNCEPCGILVEIKKNGKTRTSYANAFAEPVERIGKPDDDTADEKSIEGRSVACLADHVHSLRNAYGTDSSLLWYSPKLWRFPLQYWERTADGKRDTPKLVTEDRFEVLGGTQDKSDGLIGAVVKEVSGLSWEGVSNAGRKEPKA